MIYRRAKGAVVFAYLEATKQPGFVRRNWMRRSTNQAHGGVSDRGLRHALCHAKTDGLRQVLRVSSLACMDVVGVDRAEVRQQSHRPESAVDEVSRFLSKACLSTHT